MIPSNQTGYLKRQSHPLVKHLSTELNIAKLTATIYVSRKQ